ncbi:hypothetical protein INR79_22185 [Vibrio sp. SCSIO 43132]|uniref:hypothetical protein n=1 Tax=Vibrio sp. SCSIO 43132 TaxID=2779363 RepID=UPI001CA99241|nr:hypothetical protein [Vibrio sp. SCSIO 43132]UAB73855.1 hypothetical protein INR79_22185 [Vibrio sp. SCSIO 43132]
MKTHFLCAGLLTLLATTNAYSSETYIFIDGSNDTQKNWVENLNSLFLQEDLETKEIVIIDISDSQQTFTGEFDYIHDRDGVYMATYLPRRIPEVIETQHTFNSHSKLEDFAAKLLKKIDSNTKEQ